MATLANSLVSSSARPVRMKKRADLTVRRHRYRGRAYWVMKEPVGLKYYRFQEEEYAILNMLDGETSLDEIKERFEKEFAPQKITLDDLQSFLGMLHRSGLVIADVSGQGGQLHKRRGEVKKRERLQMMSSVLSLRFKGIDPEKLLEGLMPFTRWFFSIPMLIIWAMMALTALSLVLVQFEEFRSRLPAFNEFFASGNWFWLALTLGITKILHEFGHGLSCKRFGGECHEMGVMLLVLTPCLYCNVSDSWLLPSKWQRAAIGADGMYVEIFLSSIATFIWWYTDPVSTINQVCLRVMFISSISTLLFNGNPLLRYDGYYILADLMEIPNMRQKAGEILKRAMSKWCLGIETPENPFAPQGGKFMFGLYTIASNIYRWVVVFSIMLFLNKVFEPYGLKIIGQIIALSGIFGLVVMPLWQLGKFLYVPGRMDQVKLPNVYGTIGVVVTILAVILLVPLPYSVECSLEIQPNNAESVWVAVDGRVDEVYVKPGQMVKEGDTIATLKDTTLEMTVVSLEGDRNSSKVMVNSLTLMQIKDATAGQQLTLAKATHTTISNKLAEKQRDLSQLKLVAETDGTIIAPPRRPARPNPEEGTIPEWSGSPMDAANNGVLLQRGDLFCQIGDPTKMEADLVVDQTDIELVDGKFNTLKGEKKRLKVRIMLDAFPGKVFDTFIDEIARGNLKVAPRNQTTQTGGALNTVTDKSGVQRLLSTSFQARTAVLEHKELDGLLTSGMRGQAKIYVGWRPLGTRLRLYLSRTFHFEL